MRLCWRWLCREIGDSSALCLGAACTFALQADHMKVQGLLIDLGDTFVTCPSAVLYCLLLLYCTARAVLRLLEVCVLVHHQHVYQQALRFLDYVAPVSPEAGRLQGLYVMTGTLLLTLYSWAAHWRFLLFLCLHGSACMLVDPTKLSLLTGQGRMLLRSNAKHAMLYHF